MATAKKSDTKKKSAVAKNLKAAASVKVESDKPKLIAIRLVGAGSFTSGGISFRKGEAKEVDSVKAALLLKTGRFVEA